MNNTAIFDEDLNPVLELVTNEDLETLVDYLGTKVSETLTVSDAYKTHHPEHSKYADLIAKEVRDMGGNSFANVYRGEGPSYKEIICDVASKIKAPYNKDRTIEEIENSILETILSTALEHMSDEEKEKLLREMGGKSGMSKGGVTTAALIGIFKAGGFYSYQLTIIIANQISKAILGRGLTFAAGPLLMKTMSFLTGPIGWAITGLWTAVDIAGPSYKVTIPCVIHIAMLRKKLNSLQCEKCDAILPDTTMKFCPECGAPIPE